MNARHFLRLLGAILTALVFASPALAGTEFNGSVVSAGEGQLVVLVEAEQCTFVVNDETKITLDGEEASLSDLLAGQTASVSAEMQGDQWIAGSIAARTSK